MSLDVSVHSVSSRPQNPFCMCSFRQGDSRLPESSSCGRSFRRKMLKFKAKIDPQTRRLLYGLAFDHLTGDNGACREVFQIGAGDRNTENLRGLARNGLTWKIAARALKARWRRMDRGLLSGRALRLFCWMSQRGSVAFIPANVFNL
jgi:hypothetical protein